MRKQATQIGFIGAAVVGLSCYVAPANSATIQTIKQTAIVNGDDNRITQISKQTSLDLFFFDINFDNSNFLNLNPIASSIQSEIFEFIDDFGSSIDIIDQSIDQSAELSGRNNRITQIADQDIFDVFFLDPELKTNGEQTTDNPFNDFDLSDILGDRVAEQLVDIKQNSTQTADSLGSNNRVRQFNEQTVIDFYLIDIDYSTQLENIVVRKSGDRITEWTDFDLDSFLDDIKTNSPFDELPNRFFKNNNPIVLESNNYNVNELKSKPIPEPSSLFGLLSLGTIGLLLRQRKS